MCRQVRCLPFEEAGTADAWYSFDDKPDQEQSEQAQADDLPGIGWQLGSQPPSQTADDYHGEDDEGDDDQDAQERPRPGGNALALVD